MDYIENSMFQGLSPKYFAMIRGKSPKFFAMSRGKSPNHTSSIDM
jgi:hypothetical protein